MNKFKRPTSRWRQDNPGRNETEGSVKGKTISQPMPLGDDEFPIRTPGTSIASPVNHGEIDSQFPAFRRPNSTIMADQIEGADLGASMPSVQVSPPPQSAQHAPAHFQDHQDQPGTERSTTAAPANSGKGRHRRENSVLRSTFDRLFRKRRRTTLTRPMSRVATADQQSHTRLANSRSPNRRIPSQQRSISLPINEFNRALRSHSTHDDITSSRPESRLRDPILADEEQVQQRRATTSSRPGKLDKINASKEWTGLSPRPSGSQLRGSSHFLRSDTEMSGSITRSLKDNPNRRSRSLEELKSGSSEEVATRRRSEDTKHWRDVKAARHNRNESDNQKSSYSPRPSNQEVTESPSVLMGLDPLGEAIQEEAPQPFNFKSMKITQAADLDSRLQRIEERVHEIESALSQKLMSADPMIYQDTSQTNAGGPRSFIEATSKHSGSDLSQPYRGVGPIYLQESGQHGSQIRSWSHDSNRSLTVSTIDSRHTSLNDDKIDASLANFTSTQDIGRTASTSSTVRQEPSVSHAHLTGEHYLALINMVHAERAARQHLQAIVSDLQTQFQALANLSSAGSLLPGSAPANLRSQPAAPEDISRFEHDDDSSEEGRLESEDFEIPNEARTSFGDISGEIPVDDGSKGLRLARRTLSLTQMTLRTAQPG